MGTCFFTSDLHGRPSRYDKLLDRILSERPAGVFLGGDLLPHVMDESWRTGRSDRNFVEEFLVPRFAELKREMGEAYPQVFLILGNDDPFVFAAELEEGERTGLWFYVHGRAEKFGAFTVYGYNCVPPTPFLLKDWERYDVSRFVDPGCISPEEGRRSDGMTAREIRWTTIKDEVAALAGEADQGKAIWLFHTPPYDTCLDRAGLDGRMIDQVPLDPHVGSIAVKNFILDRQPLVTLHGHVHESTRLTGQWRQALDATHAFNGAHDGSELALVRFDPQPSLGTEPQE